MNMGSGFNPQSAIRLISSTDWDSLAEQAPDPSKALARVHTMIMSVDTHRFIDVDRLCACLQSFATPDPGSADHDHVCACSRFK